MSESQRVIKIYLTLTLITTLASSLIWGINTLFLLDAGLSITAAFAANAFFTAGQVLFEVPTGVVADTMGRRFSYLLGTVSLAVTTLLYYWLWTINGPFWAWAVVSALLGLGFTFFSGATEAWLVDALNGTGHKGTLESVFSRGQVVNGIGMFMGAIGGGLIAQASNLGVPYILRGALLMVAFVVAGRLMRDIGFTPKPSKTPIKEMKRVFGASIEHGIKKPSIRWVMLAGPFGYGVSFYAFYAAQPYLLELFGSETAYGIAGLAAAIVAGAQVGGGFLAPYARKLFKKRTSYMMAATVVSATTLILIGLIANFWAVVALLVIWAVVFAAIYPIRQAYLNEQIDSKQRATVLSTDNLLGSAGGVVVQPGLGKAADVWSYGASYVLAGLVSLLALPFLTLAKQTHAKSDKMTS